jgi:hypothetical protein
VSPGLFLVTDFFECRFTLLEILDFQKLLKLSIDWLVVCSYRYEVMSEPTPQITEAQALRLCNLPATANWRSWLRNHAASQELTTGRIYSRSHVEALADKVRQVTMDIKLPPEEPEQPAPTPRKAPSGLQHGAPTRAGQPQLANRIGGQLETR